jgi:PAB1-binding protein PBP1
MVCGELNLAYPLLALTCYLSPGNRASFRTDAAISNSRLGPERALKAWVPEPAYEIDGSLEKSSGGAWDQFAENERLFGLKTDYDENIYTTSIDKSHPQYKERLAAAERKAREIERTAPTTSHVAEERVMDFVGGEDQRDEEDNYVKYAPPTGQREIVRLTPL